MGTKGKKIENPMDLFKHKSVWVEQWGKPCATSFLVSMQFNTLTKFTLYEYIKEQPKANTFLKSVKHKIA